MGVPALPSLSLLDLSHVRLPSRQPVLCALASFRDMAAVLGWMLEDEAVRPSDLISEMVTLVELVGDARALLQLGDEGRALLKKVGGSGGKACECV